MHSLKSLREMILAETNIEPENISTFVETGTLRSHFEREGDSANSFFRIEYKATLIIIKCTLPAEYIMHLVSQWLHKNHPAHSPTAVTFEAEILDHQSVDLKINIAGINDTYKPKVQDDGTFIVGCCNQPADPVVAPPGRLVLAGHPAYTP